MEYLITRLTDRPELKAQAAAWFHAKWGVPEQAYLDSMDDALRRAAPVPQWYLAMEGPRIIGGMGVIENDFHDRKDLTPNVCAVYTESDFRRRGIAGALLQFVCRDMHRLLRALRLGILLHGPGRRRRVPVADVCAPVS